MRVVLDTNVLVAAVRSRRGASFAVLDLVERGEVVPVISNALHTEWCGVLTRDEHRPPGTSPDDALAFVDAVTRRAHWRSIHFLLRPTLRDADDDHVLELAFAAGGVPVVTHNTRDFAGSARYGVEALAPQTLLARLRAHRTP